MWWCHACSTHFTTSLDVNASEVRCDSCGEVCFCSQLSKSVCISDD